MSAAWLYCWRILLIMSTLQRLSHDHSISFLAFFWYSTKHSRRYLTTYSRILTISSSSHISSSSFLRFFILQFITSYKFVIMKDLREISSLKISALKFKDEARSELASRRYYDHNVRIGEKQKAILKVGEAHTFYSNSSTLTNIIIQIFDLKAIFETCREILHTNQS